MKKSFTLIELLIVIAIIAILAVGIIILIIPGERLAQARDATRASHLKALETALYLYVVDNGDYPTTATILDQELIEICNTELPTPNCTGLLDLSPLSITIPVDPRGGIDPNGTGYFVALKNNKLVFQAPSSEADIIATGNVVGMEGYGGIIAYVGTASPPYILISALENQSEGIVWQINGSPPPAQPTYKKENKNIVYAVFLPPPQSSPIGGTYLEIGTGRNNTNRIINLFGSFDDYAASICYNLTLNGYDDWFLPSRDELNELYKLHEKEMGGFNNNFYWSSSEDDFGGAYSQSFLTGSQLGGNRTADLFYVRCVRAL